MNWKNLNPLRLDDLVLRRLEKATQAFQKLTGRTNYWLEGKASAGVCIMIGICVMAHYAHYRAPWIKALGFYIGEKDGGVGLFFAFFLSFNHAIDAFWYWRRREKLAFDRLQDGLANPLKVQTWSRLMRIMYIAFSVPSLEIWFLLAGVSYFLVCVDPLPPCEGKVKEWTRNLGRKLVPIGATR